tara:strand:+ start:57 stop:188 length:132 start_codon:yes stop_codon:yes gene_type:complete
MKGFQSWIVIYVSILVPMHIATKILEEFQKDKQNDMRLFDTFK